MKIHTTPIKGLLVIKPRVFEDERGYFFESYRKDALSEHGYTELFVQDNESKSEKSVLRGLHFQKPPHAQAKLVRVVKGSILDIAVDIRQSSETYGRHFSITLDEKDKRMLLIPVGFAHGFVTLEDETIVNYKCTNVYTKEAEQTLIWNDEQIGIDWGFDNPIISEKDLEGEPFATFKSPFK
ncbi:MAG: dTDP-4-dehydrorhamnose 3,5-epimerase [Flavobacteriales bacterium]|nr:dTDP-4-dehydrorhamnose 3,5-epimerase [Flavobacteriales bacterium]